LQTLTYQTSYVVEKSMIDKYGDNFANHLSEGIGGDGPFKVWNTAVANRLFSYQIQTTKAGNHS